MSRQSQERLQVGVLHLFPVGHVLEVIAADFLQEKSGWNYVAITTGGSSTCFCCCHCSGVNCSRHGMSECDLLVPNTPDRLQTTDFDTCVVVRELSFNNIPCQIRESSPCLRMLDTSVKVTSSILVLAPTPILVVPSPTPNNWLILHFEKQ